MGFDAQRAVVATGDGIVARFPGILCVARSADPDALRVLLGLCAGVAGPDPGRALARKLATWMSGPDAPPETLRFGTLAAAGAQLAVFLVGEVDAWIDGPDGAVLSGSDAAIGTDRLLPVPDAPIVLSAGDVRLPAVPADVHDLRDGVVAGAGVVLHPARPAGDESGAPTAAARSAPPSPSAAVRPDPERHDWFAEPGDRPEPATAREERPASPAPRNGTAGRVNGRGSLAWPWPADAGSARGSAGITGRHAILDGPGRRDDQLLTGPVDLVDDGLAGHPDPDGEATGRTAAVDDGRPTRAGWTAFDTTDPDTVDGGEARNGAPGHRLVEDDRPDRNGADRPWAADDRPDRDGTRQDADADPADHTPDREPLAGDRRDPVPGPRNGRTAADVTPYGVLSAGATSADTIEADSVPTGLVPTAPPSTDRVPTDVVPEVAASVGDRDEAVPAEPPDTGANHDTGTYRVDGGPDTESASGYLCANGHLADPRAPYCGVCGEPVDDRAGGLVEGARPALGRLVFDDGATYTVDAGYLVGRMPEADDRVLSGGMRPIIIEDRSGSVSRVHAAIEISGWDVMLLDVGSRNGTFVAGPEETGWSALPPERGRRLLPGTRVRLGGRTFVFESRSGVR